MNNHVEQSSEYTCWQRQCMFLLKDVSMFMQQCLWQSILQIDSYVCLSIWSRTPEKVTFSKQFNEQFIFLKCDKRHPQQRQISISLSNIHTKKSIKQESNLWLIISWNHELSVFKYVLFLAVHCNLDEHYQPNISKRYACQLYSSLHSFLYLNIIKYNKQVILNLVGWH